MSRKSNIRKSQSGYKLYCEKNKKDKKILIYIICGYKSYLHTKVFGRFKKYLDINADVCLLSPGLNDQKLYNLAKKNGWVYMSTKINNLSVAQNCLLLKFSKAETIIKMDEDIFLTKNALSNLLKVKQELDAHNKKYCFIAPLLNVNSFASIKYLELVGKKKYAEKKFGRLEYCHGWERSLAENNPDFVKFLWNCNNELYSLDFANSILMKKNINNYIVCKEYFAIGLILFNRSFWWKKMHLFKVYEENGLDLAVDERQFDRLAKHTRYKRIICQKSICGHFSYTPTNKAMKEYYFAHKKSF